MSVDDYPLFQNKEYRAASLLAPANLLREARRQRALPEIDVPPVGLLDPDGDIVRHLARTGRGRRHPGWACYHTEMWTIDLGGIEIGVVGMAVGAPFAVLVAEQLVASGCQLIISVTAAGQIAPVGRLPLFVLIERALRDEGTRNRDHECDGWTVREECSHGRRQLASGLDRPNRRRSTHDHYHDG